MNTLTQHLNQLIRRVPAWPLYVLAAVLIAWHFWLALGGHYRPDPVRRLEWEYGLLALQFLLAALAITPLKRFTGLNLVKYRRALGLAAFMLALAHLLVWVVLDMQWLLGQMLTDILKRPYITVGMASFALMLPLAVTSSNAFIRRLGAARWRRLHRLVYPLALLAGVHFLWVRKGFQMEPVIYLGLIVLLLALRLPLLRRRAAAA